LEILDFRLTEAAIKAASLNGQLIRFPISNLKYPLLQEMGVAYSGLSPKMDV
jgi:hypothetical protein